MNHGFGERKTARANFWYLLCEFSLSKDFRPTVVLNRFPQLRRSKVKHKFILVLEGVVRTVAVVIREF